MATILPRPRMGFSCRALDVDARSVDWSDVRGDDDGFNVILPTPTYGDWQEHGDAPAYIDRRKASSPMNDDDAESFRETNAYYEWRDGFEPMMNYAWPVWLAYGVSVQDAADLIAKHAPTCSLIELSDDAGERLFGNDSDAPEYVIALSGGGMNLSDQIAGAYLACGCVPPHRVLNGLAGVISASMARRIRLREAYKLAQQQHRAKAANIRMQALRIFEKGAR